MSSASSKPLSLKPKVPNSIPSLGLGFGLWGLKFTGIIGLIGFIRFRVTAFTTKAKPHSTAARVPRTARRRLVCLVISQNRGAQYRPQNTIVLIIGTPKKVLLILGNSCLGLGFRAQGSWFRV